jgi:glycine betaine/proline transport system ATP-binding protein
VAHLNPLSVLTAADAMTADAGPGDPARMIAPEAPLREALPLFADSAAPVWVGKDGAVAGRISPQAVCAMLAKSAGVAA